MKTFTVATAGDSLTEGSQSVILTLSSPTGGAVLGTPSATQVALVDNERPDLVVSALTGPVQAATGVPMTVSATIRN